MADRFTPSRILSTIIIMVSMNNVLPILLHHDSILILHPPNSGKGCKDSSLPSLFTQTIETKKNVMFPRYNISYPVLRLPIRSRYPDFFRNAISRLIVPSDNPVFSHILSLLRLLSSANICKISSCLSVNFIGPFIGSFIGSG